MDDLAAVKLEPVAGSEEELVFRWRVEQLVGAGYPEADARLIAVDPEIDLRVATSLLSRGCLPETALRILL